MNVSCFILWMNFSLELFLLRAQILCSSVDVCLHVKVCLSVENYWQRESYSHEYVQSGFSDMRKISSSSNDWLVFYFYAREDFVNAFQVKVSSENVNVKNTQRAAAESRNNSENQAQELK